MKLLAFCVWVAFAPLLTTIAHAKGIYTVGVVDCGLWHEQRKTDTASSLQAYVVGLLNGLALGSAVEFWQADGREITANQAYLWIDKYCRENPLDDVMAAAVSLMNEHTHNEYKRSHH